MKITEVSYRALRTGRGYNNTSVEAKAAVDDGQAPDAVLAELRFWVDKQVDDTLKRENAYEALDDIEARKARAQGEAERLEQRIEAQRKVIREHDKLADLARSSGLGGPALLLEMAN